MSAYPAPRPGASGVWTTAPCRSGGLVSIRWDWRRPDDAPRWLVVAHDSPTPAQAFVRHDLRVLYDARDELGARERWTSLVAPREG